MDILSELVKAGGADAISRELGVDSSVAQAGMGALLPAVLGGMQQQAAATTGTPGSLSSILAGLGGGGLLDNVLGKEPTNVSQGNDILGQIFGSKEVSREVASEASQQSGVSSDLLKKMLPMVAMMVAGYLMNKRGKGGQGGGIGGSILGGIAGNVLSSVLSGKGGSNPFGSILDGLTRRESHAPLREPRAADQRQGTTGLGRVERGHGPGSNAEVDVAALMNGSGRRRSGKARSGSRGKCPSDRNIQAVRHAKYQPLPLGPQANDLCFIDPPSAVNLRP